MNEWMKEANGREVRKGTNLTWRLPVQFYPSSGPLFLSLPPFVHDSFTLFSHHWNAVKWNEQVNNGMKNRMKEQEQGNGQVLRGGMKPGLANKLRAWAESGEWNPEWPGLLNRTNQVVPSWHSIVLGLTVLFLSLLVTVSFPFFYL